MKINIEKNLNGSWTLFTDNYEKITYYFYSKNEALRNFKRLIKNNEALKRI